MPNRSTSIPIAAVTEPFRGPSSWRGTANPPTKAMAYKKVARKMAYDAMPYKKNKICLVMPNPPPGTAEHKPSASRRNGSFVPIGLLLRPKFQQLSQRSEKRLDAASSTCSLCHHLRWCALGLG